MLLVKADFLERPLFFQTKLWSNIIFSQISSCALILETFTKNIEDLESWKSSKSFQPTRVDNGSIYTLYSE